MAIWTRWRHTYQVCPTNIIVAFAFLLLRASQQDSAHAFVLANCSVNAGDSNRTEVQCISTFISGGNAGLRDVILAKFAFAIGDELGSITRCKNTGNKTDSFIGGGHRQNTHEEVNGTVVGSNRTEASSYQVSCCRFDDVVNSTTVGSNTSSSHPNGTSFHGAYETKNCSFFYKNLTSISPSLDYCCSIIDTFTCIIIDRNASNIDFYRTHCFNHTNVSNCCAIDRNVTHEFLGLDDCCKITDVLTCIKICRNASHTDIHKCGNNTKVTNSCLVFRNISYVSSYETCFCKTNEVTNFTIGVENMTRIFPDGAACCSTVEIIKCIIEYRNVTHIFCDEIYNTSIIKVDNCFIVGINETCICALQVQCCKSSSYGNIINIGEVHEGSGGSNDNCEIRRFFNLRLVSAKIERADGKIIVGNMSTVSDKLAAFLSQLENVEIYFSPNCSTKLPDDCSAPGVMEASSQCNITSWTPACDLKVRFNTSAIPLEMGPTQQYGWKGVIADLKLHGMVQSLQIAGQRLSSVGVMDAMLGLCLIGTSNIVLSYVHVSDCSFSGINLTGLKNLTISHSTLPDNCSFADINAGDLITLSLRNVGLASVPRHLSKLKSLEILDLSFNEHMVSNDVNGFVREIITWTRLRNVNTLSLAGVQLGSLSILKNLISEYDGTTCTPISNMSKLILSGCNIKDLEDESFYKCLSPLKYLDLSNNGISRLTTRVFYQLKNIKYLSLSRNYIKSLPLLELNNDTSLGLFDLSYNNIGTLSNFMTSGSTEVLDLSYNKIVEWPHEEMFCKNGTFLTWVKNLNLAYNSLKTVTRIMGDSLLVLESVDLRGNKFDCSDCNTTEFQRWLMKTMFKFERMSIVRTDSQDVICAAPKPLAGQNIVNIKIDTSHCNISEKDNYYIYVVIPLISFLFAIAIVGSLLAYKYRFELAYIRYYWSIKKRKHTLEVTENGEYEFDAFVSYSRHDRAWVLDELMEHLEAGQEKYKLCLHERDFRLGSLILENIEYSMRRSRFTLVILSKAFVDSQWCRWELEMANYKLFDDRREFLILLELEHLERKHVPRHLKYLIETRTYLEWPGAGRFDQQVTFWRRLRRALGESLHQRRQRPSIVTTTITTTTTTIIAATTTTTVVTTVANCCHLKTTPSHSTDKSSSGIPIMTSSFSSKKNASCNTAIIEIPRTKLTEESEA